MAKGKKVVKKSKVTERKSVFEKAYDNLIFSLKDIKKARHYIFFAIVFFIFFIIVGATFPKLFEEQIIKIIKELVTKTEGLGMLQLILFIMYNNMQTAFLGMVFGIFFAIPPLFGLAINGYLLGFVANKSVMLQGIGVLWKLVPHGIFELPAIMISIGYGLRLSNYPNMLKEKRKGVISMIAMFLSFFFIMIFFYMIIASVALGGDINPSGGTTKAEMDKKMGDIIENPMVKVSMIIMTCISFIIAFFIGLKVLEKKDREIVLRLFKDSIRTFIFVIIPLLVIAAIIEGTLIKVMG